MKTFFNRFVSIIVLVAFLFSLNVYASANQEISVNIDENDVIKNIGEQMYGVNFEWGDPREFITESQSTEINSDYVDCLDGYMPLARAAGMSANRLNWKGAIGNYESRTEQSFWGYTAKKQYLGPVEWIKANQQIQSDCKFIYTINMNDTQEDIGDLVEFLCGNGSTNPNGGINWANERIKLGIKKPVPIYAFELGNELDAGSEGSWNITKYLSACKETIATIKNVNPNAKISVMNQTVTWGNQQDTWMNWIEKLLDELGEDIDYISVHHYYLNDCEGINRILNQLYKDINRSEKTKNIKVIFTEHAAKPSDTTIYGSSGYRRPHTMEGVLETAEWFSRMSKVSFVDAAAYHAINSSYWAVAYSEDNTVKKTAIADLLEMCTEYFVGDSLDVTQSGYNENNSSDAFCSAVRTDDGMNIILVNKSVNDVDFKFNFKNYKYQLTSIRQLKGQSLESDNYVGYKQINKIAKSVHSDGVFEKYTADGMSFTILTLKASSKIKTETYDRVYDSFNFVSPISVNNNEESVDGKPTYYRVASGSEVGQTFDGTKVLSGDYIVRENGGMFGNNVGANNMFYWREPGSAGSMDLVKQYGGYDGYYGYVENGDICVNYANQTHKFIRPNNSVDSETVPNNTNKRGVLELSARDNHAVTFGKYDLNLNGIHVFKARIQGFNQMPKVTMQLVQNKMVGCDDCLSVSDVFEWNSLGEVRTPASSVPVASGYGCVPNGKYAFSDNRYFDVTYIIDSTADIPQASLEIRYVGNNESRLIAYLPLRVINTNSDTMTPFDFENAMGIRFKVEKSGGGGAESTLQIKSMSLEKGDIVNGINHDKYNLSVRVDNNNLKAVDCGKIIVAVYDKNTNKLINCGIGNIDNLEPNASKKFEFSLNVQNKSKEDLTVKYFVWKNFDSLFPVDYTFHNMGINVFEIK